MLLEQPVLAFLQVPLVLQEQRLLRQERLVWRRHEFCQAANHLLLERLRQA